jgi:hypothetical protein
MSLTPADLVDEIENAFKENWPELERGPLPAGSEADRGLLFHAVAVGLLRYLEANQNDLITTIGLTDSSEDTTDYTVATLNLNISGV